jgi:8-hydroxy-5-deazaflavin:NADPH oxidoreductase
MRIGMIGSGRIGGTLSRLLAERGHEVAVANSRGPEAVQPLVDEIGAQARAATIEDAIDFGEIVVVAIPWRRVEELPGDRFADKIVIDATNPFGEGGAIDVEPSTSSEEVAKHLSGARLVKAFNTLNYRPLGTEGGREPGDRLALFVAGDDEDAKAIVSRLIEELGFAPVDTGSLREGGRRQQPGSPLFNNPMTETEARAALTG